MAFVSANIYDIGISSYTFKQLVAITIKYFKGKKKVTPLRTDKGAKWGGGVTTFGDI